MKESIIAELQKLEKEREIKILFACESGSRAWGFPSPDSDYDVRFIYAQSAKRYLSIFERRDAIDLFLADDLDLIGWDIRKALRLFCKSNASPFEWMQSPVVYQQQTNFIEELKRLTPEYFSPRACLHHYLGLTKHTFLGYLQGKRVNIKKYFYALRPLLCAVWIVERKTVPPVEFQKLFPVVEHDTELLKHIDYLLTKKVEVEEKDMIDAIPYLQNFIEQKMQDCENQIADMPKTNPSIEKLNDLFRSILN